HQPTSMKMAVIRPHAMNAPMLGMIIPARNPPKRCTAALAPVPVTFGVYSLIAGTPSFQCGPAASARGGEPGVQVGSSEDLCGGQVDVRGGGHEAPGEPHRCGTPGERLEERSRATVGTRWGVLGRDDGQVARKEGVARPDRGSGVVDA